MELGKKEAVVQYTADQVSCSDAEKMDVQEKKALAALDALEGQGDNAAAEEAHGWAAAEDRHSAKEKAANEQLGSLEAILAGTERILEVTTRRCNALAEDLLLIQKSVDVRTESA